MLRILAGVEANLPGLLLERWNNQIHPREDGWNSLYIDYHPPVVERLWRDYHGCRIYLHRIHPCGEHEPLFHPHPWPSAMVVLDGAYAMTVGYSLGYGPGTKPPPITANFILAERSRYEMTDPALWHSVRPLGKPSISLMVTGKPWADPPPSKTKNPLRPLSENQKDGLFGFFRHRYPLPPRTPR